MILNFVALEIPYAYIKTDLGVSKEIHDKCERNLFYVGVTRCKKMLYLFSPYYMKDSPTFNYLDIKTPRVSQFIELIHPFYKEEAPKQISHDDIEKCKNLPNITVDRKDVDEMFNDTDCNDLFKL